MTKCDKSLQRDWPIRVECGEDEYRSERTHLLGLGLLVGGEELVRDGALQWTAMLDLSLGYTKGSDEPGMRGECGRRGRRPPWKEDA